MKIKKLIVLSCLMIFLNSCWWIMKGHNVIYIIKNKTTYNLEIVGFNSISSNSSDTIFLPSNSEQKFERTIGEDNDQRTFFSIVDVDSVHIIFDSEKLLILTKRNSNHPIIKDDFVVEITNEDYMHASPIGGN